MKIKANAKINLSLYVKGVDERNYHLLEMLMLPISIYDDITIDISEKFQVIMDGVDVSEDDSNTIVKAYKIALKHLNISNKYLITVKKHIPTMAGLGGGSSDGAAVLKAICAMEHININIKELAKISEKIGSDVPFFIYNKSAYVHGFGEKVEVFKNTYKGKILLIKPNIGVSTKEAYDLIDKYKCPYIDIVKLKEAWIKQDMNTVVQEMGNSLENSAFEIEPKLKGIKDQMKRIGNEFCLMSGSGSTMFMLGSEDMCKKVQKAFKDSNYYTQICEVEEG